MPTQVTGLPPTDCANPAVVGANPEPTPGSTQEPPEGSARKVMIYDGECGFCVASARWLARRLPPTVQFQPWQSADLHALGLTRHQVKTAAWWVADRPRRDNRPGGDRPAGAERPEGVERHGGAQAIGHALGEAKSAWRLAGWLIVHPPMRWLAGPVYDLVAANRHRLRFPRWGRPRWGRPRSGRSSFSGAKLSGPGASRG